MPTRTLNKDAVIRGYSLLTVRSVNEEKREIEGIATTPTVDRYGDIVESEGAEFKLPIPLLLHHDPRQPIGEVFAAKATKDGISIKARFAKADEPGTLKDRLDEAWQSVKMKLIRGLSIGFKPLEYSFMDSDEGDGIRFLKWVWLELSAVTIPANVDATIVSVKSIDQRHLAALGQPRRPTSKGDTTSTPGVTGSSSRSTNVKTVQEQIKDFTARRLAASERMKSIMDAASDGEGRTLDEAETQEYDGLATEVESIDKHLSRLKTLEQMNVASATRVEDANDPKKASAIRAGVEPIQLKPKLEKGIEFARFAMCLGAAKGNIPQALEIARKRFPNDGERLHTVLKAAVEAGTTTDPTWASPLVEYQIMASEFVEFLRPQTIIGRIPNLRRVPFNIKLPVQTSGGSAFWVGEGKPKPLTKFDFTSMTLRFTKLATIAVLTDELVRFSNPSAEVLTRDQLAQAIIQKSDVDFVDPAKAELANVSPASITNGVSDTPSTGNDAAGIREDVRSLMAGFLAANLTPTNGVWIMSNTTALALSLMVNALGQPEFPGITMLGGTFFGMPVVTSESVPTDSNGSLVILANASDILLADDGSVVIDASREASLEMLDNPTNASSDGTATAMVSMFQTNSVAIRAERIINWKRRREQAVAYLSAVNWGAPESP